MYIIDYNAMRDSIVKRVFFVSPMTRTFKEAIDHANARSIRGYATAACVVLEKRQLPNITGGRTPYQGCLEVFFLVARVGLGPRARAHGNGAAHFSRKVPIGMHAREIGHPTPYRFSSGRGIFLEEPS